MSEDIVLELHDNSDISVEISEPTVVIEVAAGLFISTDAMKRSVYDSNDNGIVDAAETVPWTGIQNLPEALAGTAGTPSITNKYVTNEDSRLPIQTENDALTGTAGIPSITNKYVTNEDSRLSDNRTPTTHQHPGSDITGWANLETTANKGAANGYASLGADSKVPMTQLPTAVFGALAYQGTWNATSNIPTISAASIDNKGWYYKVATAGSTSIDGIIDWQVGDWVVSNGTTWDKVDNTETVLSVAGKIGAVTLVKADVGLGSVDNSSDLDKPISTATQTALNTKQTTTEKGQANGYASLDTGGKVPVGQLPTIASTFTALTDTPSSYTGQAGKAAIVNQTENGLIFSEVTGGTEIPSSDTPPLNPEDGDLWIDTSESHVSPPLISSGNLVEKKVITANCSSVTFTGLDSLIDGEYTLEFSIYSNTGNDSGCAMYINGDTNTANYAGRYIDSQNSGLSHAAVSVTRLGYIEPPSYSVGTAKIKVIGSRVLILTQQNLHGRLIPTDLHLTTCIYSGAQVTSLLISSTTGTICTGSTFTLYKSNSAQQLVPYNPIDINSRTSDYLLKPGEVVYRDYTNATSVPLYVKTEEGEYEITIIGDSTVTPTADTASILRPNNGSISNVVTYGSYYIQSETAHTSTNGDAVTIGNQLLIRGDFKISTFTKGKSGVVEYFCKRMSSQWVRNKANWLWNDSTTPWTSLGTITFGFAQSGKIIIKRLV